MVPQPEHGFEVHNRYLQKRESDKKRDEEMSNLGNLGQERRKFLLVVGYGEAEVEKLGNLDVLTPEQFGEIVRRKFGKAPSSD